jgi:hypothetical protein
MVGWLDYECDDVEVEDTYKGVGLGLGVDLSAPDYRCEEQPLHQTYRRLLERARKPHLRTTRKRRMIDEEGIALVDRLHRRRRRRRYQAIGDAGG